MTLRLSCVPFLLLAEVALIVAISTLFALSRQRIGFVEIGFEERSLDLSTLPGALSWGQGLLWTSLPVFIIGLYKLFRNAVIAALVVETPYIELARSSNDKPVEARKSVYLDYRTCLTIVACGKAWKNKHYFLSICLFLSFVEALGLVPLTARLFAAREEILPKEATLDVLSVFDTRPLLTNANYGTLMDAVLASWVNESPLPRGTDGDFSFGRIAPTQSTGNFTISAPMNASRLTMDCVEVPMSSTTINVVKEADSFVTVSFSATDQDCNVTGSIPARTDGNDFLEAILRGDCPDTAGRLRIGFFYGTVSTAGDLTNPILVSCIPSYWSAHGTLTVETTNSTLSGRVVETPKFNATGYDIQDLGIRAQEFEEGVMKVQTFNPATTSSGNTNAPLRLAELIVRRIEARAQPYSANALIEAANRIYPAIYTMLALTYFYPELSTPVTVTGTLAVPENRLHVFSPVAIAMLAILAVLLASTIYLIPYLHYHPSILAEEPVGLLGAASLLRRSNITDIVEKYHQQKDFDGRLGRELPKKEREDEKRKKNKNKNKEKKKGKKEKEEKKKKKKQHLDDQLKEMKCWIEHGGRPHELVIRMDQPGDGHLHDVTGAGAQEGDGDSQGRVAFMASKLRPATYNGQAGGHVYSRIPVQEAGYELRPRPEPTLGQGQRQEPQSTSPPTQTPLPMQSSERSGQDYDYGDGYGSAYRNGADGESFVHSPVPISGVGPVGVRRKAVHNNLDNNKNNNSGYEPHS